MEFLDCRVFSCIGFLVSVYILLKLVILAWQCCKVYFFPTYPDFSKYGSWAVVTGSTDGIGKEIAMQLALRGQNIILISRNEEKLKRVSNEIETKYGVQTKYLPIDFTHDESVYDDIEIFLKDVDIGVMVNNVGITPPPGSFLSTANLSDIIRNVVRVNVFGVCKMHQIVLPGMVTRKRGLIINMSSISAALPSSYFTMYGATKAFVHYFSQALSFEYEGYGITIQSCLPASVSTNMTGNLQTNMLVLNPERFVKALLATVDKQRWTHGCWQHALNGWMFRMMPLWVYSVLMKLVSQWATKKLDKKTK